MHFTFPLRLLPVSGTPCPAAIAPPGKGSLPGPTSHRPKVFRGVRGRIPLLIQRPDRLGPISLHLKDKGRGRFRSPAHFGQFPGAISAQVPVGKFVPYDHRESFIAI
jgi:hypothetical protein